MESDTVSAPSILFNTSSKFYPVSALPGCLLLIVFFFKITVLANSFSAKLEIVRTEIHRDFLSPCREVLIDLQKQHILFP